MTFEEFQRKRALLSHGVLKNGIILRLPDECGSFVLHQPTANANGHAKTTSRPEFMTDNLREAGLTWLRGVGDGSSGVVESLTELFGLIRKLEGVRPGDNFEARAQTVMIAAGACSIIMKKLSEGHIEISEEDWGEFLGNLKLVNKAVEEMRGGHPKFHYWMISTTVIPCF